jgi:hypothetical protein
MLNALAAAHQATGRYDAALQVYQEVEAALNEHADLLDAEAAAEAPGRVSIAAGVARVSMSVVKGQEDVANTGLTRGARVSVAKSSLMWGAAKTKGTSLALDTGASGATLASVAKAATLRQVVYSEQAPD